MATILQYRAGVVAKDIAPFDTGNLRFNSLKTQELGGKDFAIKYSSATAKYLDALENGTKWFDGHKGFIEIKTVGGIITLINAHFNGGSNTNEYKEQFKRVASHKYTDATNVRLLKQIGGVALVSR